MLSFTNLCFEAAILNGIILERKISLIILVKSTFTTLVNLSER